ncbi:MAG: NIPSNAP family protein [Chloroflexi bacterium]|nr:NIPSNAP family protein [Chloroflexota bacterium]
MIYELRIYEVVPGKLQAVNDRFANITLNLFKKHGIKVVGFWTEDIGTSNQLVYMTAFESLADREKRWGAFQSDPEWIKQRAETERGGPLVARVTNRLLRPTSYSPMQ